MNNYNEEEIGNKLRSIIEESLSVKDAIKFVVDYPNHPRRGYFESYINARVSSDERALIELDYKFEKENGK